MHKFIFLLIALELFSCAVAYPQQTKQQLGVAVYNVGFGALTSGIGAIINKPKGTRWEKAFARGVWQGAIGGGINYAGKRTLYLINQNSEPAFAWPAKILHAAGVSIMENAAMNEPFLQNWNIDFGPVRFDFSVNGKKPFRARLLPIFIPSFIANENIGDFDFRNTILTGSFLFVHKQGASFTTSGVSALGASFGRAVIIGAQNIETNAIISHEIIHLYQFSEYQIFNTWFLPLANKAKSLKSVFRKYIYCDIPYFWGANAIEGLHPDPYYFRNFFELEAQSFATNKYVPLY